MDVQDDTMLLFALWSLVNNSGVVFGVLDAVCYVLALGGANEDFPREMYLEGLRSCCHWLWRPLLQTGHPRANFIFQSPGRSLAGRHIFLWASAPTLSAPPHTL